MIHEALIVDGYASQLPGLQKRLIKFTDGLNVLFGPNGCGKSSLLNVIKAYNGIKEGGWSATNLDRELAATHPNHYPMAYHAMAPGKCRAHVKWDGSPTFFNNGDIKVDNFAWFFTKAASNPDGMTTEKDHMDYMVNKPSSGQYRMSKINKLFSTIENPPTLTSGADGAYIQSLPRDGKITILLDEPERALSIPKQIELFKLLEQFSETYQIIIATHSPYVLFGLNANVVDFEPNYSQQCVEMMKSVLELPLTKLNE